MLTFVCVKKVFYAAQWYEPDAKDDRHRILKIEDDAPIVPEIQENFRIVSEEVQTQPETAEKREYAPSEAIKDSPDMLNVMDKNPEMAEKDATLTEDSFQCSDCEYVGKSKRALWMHRLGKHKEKG